ncbi:hypothetical protein HaLaN_09782 [Haematococcus lacustris]|uniref:Uncharacterized protein n=1 Tax=Haematococcus lacustris TaxID=44745 RepID=A0A699YVR4_HAELA|nr:hypothetical protein HaLaN_09782 [Haematococcus lacustris]
MMVAANLDSLDIAQLRVVVANLAQLHVAAPHLSLMPLMPAPSGGPSPAQVKEATTPLHDAGQLLRRLADASLPRKDQSQPASLPQALSSSRLVNQRAAPQQIGLPILRDLLLRSLGLQLVALANLTAQPAQKRLYEQVAGDMPAIEPAPGPLSKVLNAMKRTRGESQKPGDISQPELGVVWQPNAETVAELQQRAYIMVSCLERVALLGWQLPAGALGNMVIMVGRLASFPSTATLPLPLFCRALHALRAHGVTERPKRSHNRLMLHAARLVGSGELLARGAPGEAGAYAAEAGQRFRNASFAPLLQLLATLQSTGFQSIAVFEHVLCKTLLEDYLPTSLPPSASYLSSSVPQLLSAARQTAAEQREAALVDHPTTHVHHPYPSVGQATTQQDRVHLSQLRVSQLVQLLRSMLSLQVAGTSPVLEGVQAAGADRVVSSSSSSPKGSQRDEAGASSKALVGLVMGVAGVLQSAAQHPDVSQLAAPNVRQQLEDTATALMAVSQATDRAQQQQLCGCAEPSVSALIMALEVMGGSWAPIEQEGPAQRASNQPDGGFDAWIDAQLAMLRERQQSANAMPQLQLRAQQQGYARAWLRVAARLKVTPAIGPANP